MTPIQTARRMAKDVTELLLQESARINREHGLIAAKTFLERLRDNLNDICPSKQFTFPTVREWNTQAPSGFVVIQFEAEVEFETTAAFRIGSRWIPKSVMHEAHKPQYGDLIRTWPVKLWFADKEQLYVSPA